MVLERLLQLVELAVGRGEQLDRADLAALRLHGEREARTHRRAVDHHRAAAADAVLAADMGAGRTERLAQEIAQQHARLGLGRHGAAVERQPDAGALVAVYAAHA